ncbi:MAG: alpha/beta hydrolase-fold protein [Acidimicrobiales bacterium]
MRPWSQELIGHIDEREFHSPSLDDNPLGDPSTRPIAIYTPPGYAESDLAYPSIYVLHGYGSHVATWSERHLFDLTVPERIDEVFAMGGSPCVVVYVDAWTRFGGSQYVDSPGTGNYHTYLSTDVISYVDENYRTIPAPQSRAVIGQSSGGIGAITASLLRPDVFGAFAAHAPDACFDLTMRGELALAHRALRDLYDSSYDAFFSDFSSRLPMSRPSDFTLQLVWAMSACYSSDPDGTVRVPFDLSSGQLIEELWERWLDWDPYRLIPRHKDAVRQMRAIWLDSGRRDENLFDVAAEMLAHSLSAQDPKDFVFELYEGTHRDYRHRFATSVRYLAERLKRD